MFGRKKQNEAGQTEPQNKPQDRRIHPSLPRPSGAAIKQSLHAAGFRHGSYSAGMTAIVLAILIVVNMLVGLLPTSTRTVSYTHLTLPTILLV